MRTNLVNKMYEAQPYYDKAEELLVAVNKEERRSWLEHPCTQSLVNTLNGDVCENTLMLLQGAYSNETSIDATAQNHAKARGMVEAVMAVLEHLENFQEEEEDFDKSSRTSSSY